MKELSQSIIRLHTALLILLSGCGFIYHVDDEHDLVINLPQSYLSAPKTDTPEHDLEKPWWKNYDDGYLDELVTQALHANLSLKVAWERMRQVEAQKQIAQSGLFPSIAITSAQSRSFTKSTTTNEGSGEKSKTSDAQNNFSLGASLSYQIDLWNRTRASEKSGSFLAQASRADVENSALLLSGSITETYLKIQELKAIMRLLREQVKVSGRMLKLTKYRFKLGQSSALDVYQQQLQLTAIRGEIPLVRSELKQALNSMAVLTGQEPGQVRLKKFSGQLPPLPPLPAVSSPKVLIESRPDLRAWRKRLFSSKYDVASAYGEKFPSLDLSLSYAFNAQKISDLVSGQIGQLLHSILLPVFDGDRRDSHIEEREAFMRSTELQFRESILIALRDVENALIAEKELLLYHENLEKQLMLASATLRESRKRYLSGAIDYLQVTIALQALQSLERNKIASQARVLAARNRLYLALGGTWTDDLSYHGGDT